MSQVHPQYLTLEELVGNSAYVLVVEKLVPPVRYETVTKYGDVTFRSPQKVAVYRFRILEKIYGIYAEDRMPLQGKEKGVYAANADTALEVQARYEKDGTMKSPYYANYEPGVDFEKEDRMIIFVRRSGDHKLSFVADGAYESLAKRAEIEALCEKEGSKNKGVEMIDTFGE